MSFERAVLWVSLHCTVRLYYGRRARLLQKYRNVRAVAWTALRSLSFFWGCVVQAHEGQSYFGHRNSHPSSDCLAAGEPFDNGQRKLFTEEASTVLAFENGGVIRLSAAVAVGQLLFLTNMGTRREVVAQVMRKRDFRPTSCYVEVEFSEPAPGFWGIEFPEMVELSPANAQQKEAAELVRAAEAIAGEPSVPARVPSAYEVTALKQQVEALREQLRSLQTQTGAENSSAPAVAHDAPSESKHKAATGGRSGVLRIGFVAAGLLLAAGSAARYLHWLPRLPQPKRISAAAAAGEANAGTVPTASSVIQRTPSNSGTTTLASVAARPPSSAASPDSAAPSSQEATIVPPKLIKSVRAIASPEALRDFATGNMTLDAVVDASGHVKMMKVLTGPPSLQNAAMDALKQYQYAPSTQRG